MLRAIPSRPDLHDPTLAARWAALDNGGSAFLSAEWVFCLAGERYRDPVLIEVFEHEALVGMALFNRRRTWFETGLHLHETGDPEWDSVFVEHNGAVAASGRHDAVLRAVLACATRLGSRVVLSGIDDAGMAAARETGSLGRTQTRLAPFLPLAPGGLLMPLLSRNTRAQLRRSERSYAATGPIIAEAASDVPQALDWLDRLLPLHVATWSGRGIASGFAAAPMQRFHRELIRRGLGSGLVELLRISAGGRVPGYLLNLRAGGRVANYQAGFDYADAAPHEKPGLTCHAAAIARAWDTGAAEYDFLAGDSRYKRSLASDSRALHWIELCRPLSLAGAEAAARRLLRR